MDMQNEIEFPGQKKPELRTCARPGCGIEFTATNPKRRYCSNGCRGRHSIERSAMAGMESREPVELSATGLSPQAQYIIRDLEKRSDRWERLYDEATGEIKDLLKERDELRNALATVKTDQRIRDIENARPGGLGGLLDHPAVSELVPHLGRILESWLAPGGAPGQIAGPQGAGKSAQIIKWLGMLPSDVQDNIYRMLDELSKIQDVATVNNTIQRIINLLTNGTTAQTNGAGAGSYANATATATGTF